MWPVAGGGGVGGGGESTVMGQACGGSPGGGGRRSVGGRSSPTGAVVPVMKVPWTQPGLGSCKRQVAVGLACEEHVFQGPSGRGSSGSQLV